MNTGFDGKQTEVRMRDAPFEREEGILGCFLRKVKVGDIQLLYFAVNAEDKDGPFWVSMKERAERREDVAAGEYFKAAGKNKARVTR
jgi:hypothetical protein